MIKNRNGVTLIEVVLIIAILSIVFIPSFTGRTLKGYRERKELRELLNDINYARNMSIVESSMYGIEIDVNSNTYSIYKYIMPNELIKKKKLINGTVLNSTNIDDDMLLFGYSGAPQKAGTIYLSNSKGKAMDITISPVTGRINTKCD